MIDTAIIEKQAMQLSEADRAVLADHLIQSLSRVRSSLRESWLREAQSRTEAYRQGEIEAVDGPEAMAQLRSRFEK